MRNILMGGVLLAALYGGPALSADLPVGPQQRPVMVGAFSWTSWYVGAFAGGAISNNASTSFPCGTAPIAPPAAGCWRGVIGTETVSYSMRASAIGGATAGYNYQIPGSAIVFGLETEFGALRLRGSSAFATAPTLGVTTTLGNWYNATTVRIGWAWDRLLFYGKGGFSLSTIESTLTDAGGLGPATGKKDLIGWAWGAGLEYAFAPNWSVKGEYLGLGLNHAVGVCATPAPGAPTTGNFCSNTSTQFVQTAKVGVNYLFNVGPVYARY